MTNMKVDNNEIRKNLYQLDYYIRWDYISPIMNIINKKCPDSLKSNACDGLKRKEEKLVRDDESCGEIIKYARSVGLYTEDLLKECTKYEKNTNNYRQ